MSREIKFRAWSKKRKTGYDIIEQEDIQVDVQPKDCLLMQYTGLKDKNGKEIYEGDYVIRRWLNPHVPDRVKEEEIKSLVLWDDEDKWFSFRTEFDSGAAGLTHGLNDGHQYHKTYEIEVIGNIHENPELRKEV